MVPITGPDQGQFGENWPNSKGPSHKIAHDWTSVLNRSQNSESIITELFDSTIDSKSIFGQIYQVLLDATWLWI